MPQTVQVTAEFSRPKGYLVIYMRFRVGKVHTTYEITPEVSTDVDREGRVLGVEVVKTFSRKARAIKLEGVVNLDEIQQAVEARFARTLSREFDEVREFGAAVFATA